MKICTSLTRTVWKCGRRYMPGGRWASCARWKRYQPLLEVLAFFDKEIEGDEYVVEDFPQCIWPMLGQAAIPALAAYLQDDEYRHAVTDDGGQWPAHVWQNKHASCAR